MPILLRTLRDRRAALAWWTFGLVVYIAFIIGVWPVVDGNQEFEDLYADMPDSFQAMFGGDVFTEFTTPPGFLNAYLYSLILPFIVAALAISMGSSLLAGEEEDGLLDLVLSNPVRRRTLVAQKIVAIALAVLGLGLVTVVVVAVAREPVSLDIGITGLFVATSGTVLFALMHGLVALSVGAWRGSKGAATGVAWAVVLIGYLANVLASLDQSLELLEIASPLHWATSGSPLDGTLPAAYLALAVAIAALAAAAIALFERHDLS